MAVGRISGPLLKSNLLRNGIDIAFESDLLYLDVNNQRIGIKTDTPTNELEIAGTTQTSDLLAGSVIVDNVEIDQSTITTSTGDLTIKGASDFDTVFVPRGQIPVIENDTTITGSLTVQGALNLESLFAINDIDINGGTIDGAAIGSSSPSVIIGSTITANSEFIGPLVGDVTGDITSTGTSTFSNVDINGGAIDGTTIGGSTPDLITGTTITANTEFVGALTGNVTGDITSTGTSTFSNVDINGGAIDDVDIGNATPVRSVHVDNIKIDNNSITSTNTDGVIRIAPNGAGIFQIESDTLRLGSENENVEFTTWGTGDITVSTNSGLDSGKIVIPAGVDQDITIEPNGTGYVVLSADTTVIGDADQEAKLTTQGTGNLVIDTNNGSDSGAIILQHGTNSDIIFEPNSTGRTIAHNLYVDDGSQNRSIKEYIQDINGEQFVGTDGVISVVYNDTNGTTTVDLVETGVSTGSYGSTTQIPVFTVDADGRISTASTVDISTTLNLSGDNSSSGEVDLLTDSLNFTAVNALTAEVSSNIDGTVDTVTVTADSATTSSRGVASFDPTNFTVSAGNVVGNDIILGATNLALGTATSTLQGLDLLEVDNIQIDNNEISSTDANGDIKLNPSSSVVDVANSRIVNINDPVNSKDATNKKYVDEVAQGLQALPAADVATDSELSANYNSTSQTLSGTTNGEFPTIDGITIAEGDNVLVKDQSNLYENGSYVLTTLGDSTTPWLLTRCSFCDETSEVLGAFEFVTGGTVYVNTGWVATTPTDFEIDNTNPTSDTNGFTTKGDIEWVQFSGAGTYTAGTNLNLDGTEFNLNDDISINDLSVAGISQFTSNSDLVLNPDGTVSSAPFIVSGGAAFEKDMITIGQAVFADSTDSTSVDTGSVVVSGGLGIAKTASVGEDLIGSGSDTSAIDGFEIDGGTY